MLINLNSRNRSILWVGLSTDIWNRVPLLIKFGWKISIMHSIEGISNFEKVWGKKIDLPMIEYSEGKNLYSKIISTIDNAKIIKNTITSIVVVDYRNAPSAVISKLIFRDKKPVLINLLAPPDSLGKEVLGTIIHTFFFIVCAFTNIQCLVSSYKVEEKIKHFSFNLLKCNMAETGVDTAHFTPLMNDEFPQETSDGNIIAAYHGVLAKVRKLDFLLEVMTELKKRGSRCKLEIVGNGDDFKRLVDEATKLALNDVITFKNIIPYNKLPKFLRKIKIELVPLPTSKSWGIPYKILEAMSCGIPVIATKIDITEEIQKDSKCLILLNNDPKEWVNEIILLENDLEKIKILGKKGRDYVIVHRSWFQSAKKFNAVLQEMISR